MSQRSRGHRGRWLILCACIAIASATAALAQDVPSLPDLGLPSKAPAVSVSGSITVSADFYGYSASPDSAQSGRRPERLYRVIFTPLIEFGEDFSLPFNLSLTTPEMNTMTPGVESPTLPQVFQNPANAFGMSSVTPKLAWAEFFLGSHTPRYSDLTSGDQPLFGAGFDLTPGSLRVSASYGTTQRAVEPDTARGTGGAFRRDQYMARVGYGKENESGLALNAVFARDDPASVSNPIVRIVPARPLEDDPSVLVPPDTVRLRAAEGAVVSLSTRAVIVDGLDLTAEAALSSFTSDLTSDVVELKDNPLGSVLTTRASTRADFGGNAALNASFDGWGVKVSALYLGAGFVPIGYAYGQADRFELAVAPYFNLFDGKLSVRGSIGQRINNLSDNAGETSRHLIGSANVSATISDAFSVSAQYSNYGVRSDQTNDTLRIQNVNQSLSIDPTLTWAALGAQHMLTTSLALDVVDDFNVVTGEQSSNDTRSLLASYTASLDSIPVSLGLIANYLENRLFTGALIVRSIGANASVALLDGAIEPRISLTVGSSTVGAGATDDQLLVKGGVRFRLGSFLSASVDVGSNRFDYGDPRIRGDRFDETLVQVSLSSQF